MKPVKQLFLNILGCNKLPAADVATAAAAAIVTAIAAGPHCLFLSVNVCQSHS